MTAPVQIRMGGYGPSTTSFSHGLNLIGDKLAAEFGDKIDIKYIWNIMDLSYRAEDILWLVEHGLLTLGYQSSSYLTDRVPSLGVADLPRFATTLTGPRPSVSRPLGSPWRCRRQSPQRKSPIRKDLRNGIHPPHELKRLDGGGWRRDRDDVRIDQIATHRPASRIGPRSRSAKSPCSSGADISSRPKEGTRDSRSQSAKQRTTASGFPCRVMTEGLPRVA
jgi:hypothetical protein